MGSQMMLLEWQEQPGVATTAASILRTVATQLEPIHVTPSGRLIFASIGVPCTVISFSIFDDRKESHGIVRRVRERLSL